MIMKLKNQHLKNQQLIGLYFHYFQDLSMNYWERENKICDYKVSEINFSHLRRLASWMH